MKKYTILILTLILTAALFTGCGCRNSKPMNTTVPTTMPTVPTVATTEETTRATTTPTTRETIEDGNGPLPTDGTDTTETGTVDSTDNTAANGRARTMPRER